MNDAQGRSPGFHPLRVIIPVVVALLAISWWSRWYAGAVSVPRYCEDPGEALRLLERVVNEPEPAGDDARRPYLVAAKLLFLVPREGDEPVSRYLLRVERYLDSHCA